MPRGRPRKLALDKPVNLENNELIIKSPSYKGLNFKIGDNWAITASRLDVVLLHKPVKRDNEEPEEVEEVEDNDKPNNEYAGWQPHYFSNPQNALKYLVNQEVIETDLVDLKTVVEKIDKLYNLIDSLKITV